ncbi:MAG: NAD-dependent succinate-semialdehyde dehydrogenase [Acidobacteria bacterium]|nr:NAD-dependent succinate-semialdehyde dehydrogenase [Acidobacteriota bacterium]
MQYQTVNPATEEVIREYSTMDGQQVGRILGCTRQAWEHWRRTSVEERAAHVRRLGEVLRRNRDDYAPLMTQEMGKPITEARAEVEKCAWLCDVYAENGPQWLADEMVEADGELHQVVYQPLGVILSIMPWNYPFWQALRFAVPTLLAGNTSLLKHASNVTGCALVIEELFRDAGFPDDVFRTILADHKTVQALIADNVIRGVSLTGSTAAGRRIGQWAGRHLKKVVLELGGSDPFIVLDDADPEVAARNAVTGRTLNTGQSCIAAKRFIVMESLLEPFVRHFAARMEQLVVGDPMAEETRIGPLVNAAAREEIEDQLARSVAMGAQVLTGGRRPPRKGYFLTPAVVTDVTPDMPVFREEVFGPVAPVIAVRSAEEALRLANASEFGLGGSVWTRDLERGIRLVRQVESGSVFVNSIVKSDPRMPFGGVKNSGLGRELARFGLHEFVNIKGLNVYRHP